MKNSTLINVDASSLRLGNYVYGGVNNLPCCVNSLSYVKADGKIIIIASAKSDNGIEFEQLRPIPLTEEILFRYGFTLNRPTAEYTKSKTCFSLLLETDFKNISRPNQDEYNKILGEAISKFKAGEGVMVSGEWHDEIADVRIKYLHQLQNLYFALTGKELGV